MKSEMKKKKFSSLTAKLAALLFAFTCAGNAWGALSGSGTEADPYLISSKDDMVEFGSNFLSYTPNSANYFKVVNDIDLQGVSWTPISLGQSDASIHKTFYIYADSQKVLSNLSVTAQYAGLFGYLSDAGRVITFKNLTIDHATVVSHNGADNRGAVGAFVGYTETCIIIENCHVTNSSISGEKWNGGLIGYTTDNGSGEDIVLKNCSVSDTQFSVSGSCVGGLFGMCGRGDVVATGCMAKNVTCTEGTPIDTGVVIGRVVNGQASVGGCSADNMTVKVGDAEAVAVTDIVGQTYNNSTVVEIDPLADPSWTKVSDGFYQKANTYAASTDFYITSKAGLEYFRDLVNGKKSVTDDYMEKGFYSAAGFHGEFYSNNLFSGKTVHLCADIDLENSTWEPIGYVHAYTDAEKAAYYVETTENSGKVSAKTYFYGNFDGQNHKISNIRIENSDTNTKGEYGLFGRIGGDGAGQSFSNLTLENVSVSVVNGGYVGAIVGNGGTNTTTFDKCHVIGNINISSKASGAFVGGIVGTATSTIDDCSVEGSTGSTIEGSTVGGLAGTSTRTAKENANTVTDSTVTGVTVKSDDNGGQAGGLVGKATNPVTVTGNTVHDVTVSAEAGKADALVGGVGGDVTASSNTTDTNVTVISKPEAKLGSEDSAGKGMSLAELAASWGAAYANEVITLGQDVALDKRIYFYKGVTIDLNGHKLTLQAEDERGFYLDDGSIMVLKDSGTGGTFEHAYVGGIAIFVRTGSSLTFKNGIYNVGGNLTYNNGGTIAIESGVYTVGLSNVAIWTGSGTSTVSGGYFNVTRDTINWVVDGKLVEEVKEGQYAGYYLVRDIVDSDYVAENTTTGKRYLTLSDAMAEAKSGEVVQLIKAAVSGTLSFVPDGVVFNDNGFASTMISGAGTPSDPYLIKDIDLLKAFRNSVNAGSKFAGKYFKLTSDIDLNNEEWTPIGDYYKEFCGVFDGDNHTISNLRVTAGGRNAYGLFGKVMKENEESSKPAGIVNVTINNATVKSPAHWAGALAGAMYTGLAVENCHLKGDIDISVSSDGGYYAGGLVGYGGYVAYVDCSVKGNEGSKISGALYVGGIVAWHAEDSGIIRNCSVEGVSLNGKTWVGGIAGLAHYGNTVAECSVANINVAATDNGYAGQIVGLSLGKAGSLTTVVDNTVDAKTVVVTAGGEEVAVQIGTENDPYAIVGWDVEKDTDGKVVGGTFERLATEALADGYILSEPNAQGLYTVEKEPVAQIGETKYTSLAAAVEAVPENGAEATTIKMIADVELDATVTIPANKNVVLDLNGKTVSGAISGAPVIRNNGTLAIADSGNAGTIANTLDDSSTSVKLSGAVNNYGTLTLNGGSYSTSVGGSYVIYTGEGATTVNDCTVTGGAMKGVFQTAGGTLVVNDADVDVSCKYYVFDLRAGATVTVAGGTFNCAKAFYQQMINLALKEGGENTLNIAGGTFTFSSTALQGDNQPEPILFNGTVAEGATAAVNISGGAFSYGSPYFAWLNGGATLTDSSVSISGGIFNVSPVWNTQSDSLIAADYEVVSNTDAATKDDYPYTVISAYEAQIVRNGAVVTPKGTLTAMIAAAQAGDTVQLLKDIELTDRLFVNAGATPAYEGSNNRYATTSENKSVTLDLNGFNITSESNIALAGGSLNITGTGKISTTNDGLAPIEVRGTGDLAAKRTLTIGSDVTLEGGEYGLNVFGSNDAQKNLIDVTVNGTVNGTLFVLGNLSNAENEINIVVNGTVAAPAGEGDNVNVGIALNGNANVTVNNDATVSGDSGIEVRAGTLTVNGGTITGTASEYSYKANGSGSTTKGAAIAVAQHGTALDTVVTLNGGTLEGVKTIGVTDVNGNMDKVSVLATQGYTAGSSIPDDYKWVAVENTDPAMYRLTAKDYVAQVGEAKYEVFADAWEAANAADGSTLKLLADVELTEQYQADGNFTLDLNGKNINTTHRLRLHTGSLAIANTGAADETHGVITTSNAGMAPVEVRYTDDAATPSAKRALTIGAGVTLTGSEYGLNVFGTNSETKNVIDVTVDGTVNGTLFVLGNLKNAENEINIVVNGKVIAPAGEGDNVNVGIALNGNAKVTVNNDATVSGDSGIEVRAGTLTVNGGTITGTASEYSYKANGSGSTTKGAAIAVAQHGTALDTVVTLNGGTLEGVKTIGVTDVNGNMDNVEVLAKQGFTENSAIPDDYKWVETETSGVYELVPKDYVAQIGDDGEKFETLAEAFAAAQSGETVKLLKDIELTNRLFVNAGATPAYGGSNNRYATTSENKTLTLDMNDHDITGSSNIALAGGSLTITGTGKISTTTSGLAPIEVRGTGSLTSKRTLTIDTGVTLEGKCYGVNVFGSNNADKNVIDVNVNGTVKGMVFVLGNLTNSANEININVTGTVDASAATGEESVHTAIAQCGYSTVTVSDGAVVKGESGIETRAGTLTVNGGTITATEAYNYASNGSGTTTKGAAVAVAQYGADRVTSVTINNGTLSGEKKIAVTDVNNDMSKVKVFAKEADTTPTVIPAGYSWAKSTEKPGMWTLVKQLDSFTYPIEGTAGIPVDLQWLEDNLEDVTLPILETQTDDIIAALSEQGDNGIPVWQSYVLGLDPSDPDATLRLTAEPVANESTKVVVSAVINLANMPVIAGTTVSFRLAARNGDEWATVESATPVATLTSDGPNTTPPATAFIVPLDDVAGKVLAIFADIVTE